MFYETGFITSANSAGEKQAVWVGICCAWVWGISFDLNAKSHRETTSENVDLHQIFENKG